MNLQEFKNQYGHLKDIELITVICDHPLHDTGPLKPIKAVSVRRNILKHGGEKFICRSCHMKNENPMQKKTEVNRKSLGTIDVKCPKCLEIRPMDSSCYFGSLVPPYEQLCGSCVQKGKEIPEEQRNKISESLTGRELTEEHKKKIGEYMKNNPEGIERGKNNLIAGFSAGWNKGQETSEEVRQKISEGNTGKKRTLEQRLNVSKGRKKMIVETGGFTREHREKISKNTIEQYKRGFDPKLFHLRGYHWSNKLQKLIRHKSSYEKKVFMLLDADSSVKNYEYEVIDIEYFNPIKEITSTYLIDLKIVYIDGRESFVEIKPMAWFKDKEVSAKLDAAREWANKNNFVYEVWTESLIYGPIDTNKKVREFTDCLRVYLNSEEYSLLLKTHLGDKNECKKEEVVE